MKLIYDEFEEYWVWVSLTDENNELSPTFDEKEHAMKWVFDVVQALGTL